MSIDTKGIGVLVSGSGDPERGIFKGVISLLPQKRKRFKGNVVIVFVSSVLFHNTEG